MAITQFIPTVWSETLYRQLDKEYIAVKNCSREFEGDIKNMGDTVKIIGLNPINVFDYTKNTDMSAPGELSDNVRMLTVNRAKAFNFVIDDIEAAQTSPVIMKEAMRVAASALSNEADKYIYSLYETVPTENVIKSDSLTSDGVLDLLLNAQQKLLEKNVPGNEEIVLEVPPCVAAKIIKAKIMNGTSNEEELDKGCIGKFLGFRIYVSNNIVNAQNYHKCFARTKRAIAFAEQINEVEAYRPEKRFADAVKGLHLYGAKVVYPDEILVLDISVGDEAGA
ncbi:MAG: hypothetical protein IKL21_06580 [Clostridia bacterium]|jgi:hypothetical protein|nr:hypothetical protein [Clostridia bacterium]